MLGLGQAVGWFRGELINRIQGHELNAGLRVDHRPLHFFFYDFDPAHRARIAITPHWQYRQAAFVINHVIHPPRIGADAGHRQFFGRGFFQAGLEFIQQAVQFPMQRASHLGGSGGKPVQLFQRYFSLVERAENKPAAVRAQITGKIISRHKFLQFYAPFAWCQNVPEFKKQAAIGKVRNFLASRELRLCREER